MNLFGMLGAKLFAIVIAKFNPITSTLHELYNNLRPGLKYFFILFKIYLYCYFHYTGSK